MQYVLLAMLMLTWQEVAELNRVMTAKHNEVGQRFFETVQLVLLRNRQNLPRILMKWQAFCSQNTAVYIIPLIITTN